MFPIERQKQMNKNSTVVVFAAIVGIMMATLSTTITSMPITSVQGQVPPPPGPPVHVGNPTDLSTGPPVPNCNAIIQGNFHGPPDDTMRGCK
jgi:hypothetical protein